MGVDWRDDVLKRFQVSDGVAEAWIQECPLHNGSDPGSCCLPCPLWPFNIFSVPYKAAEVKRVSEESVRQTPLVCRSLVPLFFTLLMY